MTQLPRFTPPRFLALLLVLMFPALLARAADPVRAFDVPAGDAAVTLKQAAKQGQVEIVFPAKLVAGVTTAAVKGDFTARAALNRMLAGTELVLVTDEKSGALTVNRLPREEKNVSSRRADAAAAQPDAKADAPGSHVENGVVKLEKVEVTGSRIRSILGEQSASPVLTWTREDIDQSGATSLADIRNLIPQLSVGQSASFDGNSSGSSPEGRLLLTMRGLTGNNTLLLVDGRRVAKTGQRGVTEAYEATGIPLSAVERIEVLTDGGSALYGADAIGGVVNIILKKNYTGSEIEYNYDNTFDKDAANKRVSLTSSVARGKWNARFFASYEHQNAMARRDRWWLRSDDRRYLGGSNSTSSNYPIGGRVVALTGTLPGLGTTSAYLPTNSDGRNLTIADFANAPATPVYDAGQYQNAVNEYDRVALSGHVGYDYRPWAKFDANYNFARNRSYGLDNPVTLSSSNSSNPAANTVVPAGYPGNPFGVPILVQKYLWELGPLNRRYRMDSFSANVGVQGDLPRDWHYDGSLSWSKSTPTTLDQVYQFDQLLLAAAMHGSTPPVVLNNSLTYGAANPAGTYEALFYTGANGEGPQTYTYTLNATGPVYTLPAGPVQVAVGSEMREEYVAFNRQNYAASTESAAPKSHRTVTAFYGELSVPLVSPQWKRRIPLVHTLVLSAAGREDHYNDFGGGRKPRVSGQYRPVSWIMVRGSRSQAFKTPLLVDLTRPVATSTFNVPATGSSSILDLYRNNEPFTGPIANTTGGNPNLRPENSTSTNYGIVVEAPVKLLKGLSLSADRWDIMIHDRVGSLTFQERLQFFPEMFTRAALTPEDQAAGYTVGRLSGVDNRSVNIALYHTSGIDYSLRYDRPTPWGNFSLKATATRTDRLQAQTRPGAAYSTSVSAVTRPTRGVGTLSWTKSGLGFSATATHQTAFRISATSTVEYPPTTVWNANAWYDFDTGKLHPRQGWIAHWLRGTRVSAGLINAMNAEPDLSPTGGVSGAIDPRLRRYTLSLRKRF